MAGVAEVVLVSPPASDKSLNAAVLAAARVAGVTEAYKVGGAQAIAALAYGTETIRRVDKIVGPGNMYVALAKSKVFGQVGIDMVAGPSEVVVVADEGANPEWVAADLLAQAEHDPMARAVLLTPAVDLIERVAGALEGRLADEEVRGILKDIRLQAGDRFLRMKTEGRLPASPKEAWTFWNMMMEGAEERRDAASFQGALDAAKARFKDDPNQRRILGDWERKFRKWGGIP